MSAVSEVMYGKITRLSHTWRYSAQPVIIRENVAEHSFWTAMIGIVLAEEVGRHEVSGSVALQALLHDIEECMTGDVIRDMKYATPEFRQHFAVIEKGFVEGLIEDMGETGRKIYNTWEDAKGKTVAGEIVAVADWLSVIAYCTREASLGNLSLAPIRDAMTKAIKEKTYQQPGLGHYVMEALRESYERWPTDAR